MELIQIQINSSKTKMAPQSREDEVQQTLIINRDGAIYFHALQYGNGYMQYERSREMSLNIDPGLAHDIIHRVALYFARHGSWGVIPNMGTWKLILRDVELKTYDYYGSFTGAHHELTDLIREHVPISGLFVFDDL